MKAKKIRIFLFILIQAMLWQKTISTYRNFSCRGLSLTETQKLEEKFAGMKSLYQGSASEIRGTKEYVYKKVMGFEVRTMLAFHDQLQIVEFYNPEDENNKYRKLQCFYPKNLNKYHAYLVLPKYFSSLYNYINVKKSYITKLISWKFDMMIKITIGIKKLHDNGFIHCDIKPENIFMMDQFDPLIGDLGEALSLHEEKDYKSGTDEYLAPEIAIATNKFNYTNKVDIFSLGVLFVDIIAEGMSSNGFIPQQEKFKKENIQQYYQMDEKSKTLYDHFESLILQMTSDVPSFRPTADQVLLELVKRFKHYLDEDQNTTKEHMKAYNDYIKMGISLFTSDKGPNEYHHDRKKILRYYMKLLVTHEVNYFKTGKLDLEDNFFKIKDIIPSEALDIKNPEVQFIKKSDLQGSSYEALVLTRAHLRPRPFNSSNQYNQVQSRSQINTAQNSVLLSGIQNSMNTQNDINSLQKLMGHSLINNIQNQQLQDNQKRNSLQNYPQSNQDNSTQQPERKKFILSSNNNNNQSKAADLFRQKMLKQQQLKKQQEEEKLNQQKLEQEKNTLIENQLNIVNSIISTLESQLAEQQHKMINDTENQEQFKTEKQELFSQAKIVINELNEEKLYIQQLKSSKPEQVKEMIKEVHERISQADQKADQIQNKFYEIEKQLEQEKMSHQNNDISIDASLENQNEFSLFSNDIFNFDDLDFPNKIKGRASTIYNIRREFSDDKRRHSIPAKLDKAGIIDTKEQVIQHMKQKFQKYINKNKSNVSSNSTNEKNEEQISQNNEQSQSSQADKKSEQNQSSQLDNKSEQRESPVKLQKQGQSLQEQMHQMLLEHINTLGEQKPLTKQQVLDMLLPKQSKTFHEKKSRKNKDFSRSVTQSQSIQQRKMKRNKGNQWKRILI